MRSEHQNNAPNDKLNKALKITKRVLSGIGAAICALLLVVAGWLCIDKFIIGSTVPSFCGYSTLIVSTGSMSGTVEIGDVIIIKDTGDYKIGDIVSFLKPGETVPTTHRIINYGENGGFITKGDANNSKDRLDVAESEILGEMVVSMHGLGLFLGWAKDGGGFIYILAILLVIGIGVYLIKEEKEKEKMRAAYQKQQEQEAAEAAAKAAEAEAEISEAQDPPEDQKEKE